MKRRRSQPEQVTGNPKAGHAVLLEVGAGTAAGRTSGDLADVSQMNVDVGPMTGAGMSQGVDTGAETVPGTDGPWKSAQGALQGRGIGHTAAAGHGPCPGHDHVQDRLVHATGPGTPLSVQTAEVLAAMAQQQRGVHLLRCGARRGRTGILTTALGSPLQPRRVPTRLPPRCLPQASTPRLPPSAVVTTTSGATACAATTVPLTMATTP